MTFLAGQSWGVASRPLWRLALAGFLVWAALVHPLSRPSRLGAWARCWSEGSSPSVRDQLTLDTQYIAPKWAELAVVAQFLRAQGVGVLIIEHVMAAVMSLSDRIVVLHHGEKIAEGPPAHVARHPDVVQAYLGEEYLLA